MISTRRYEYRTRRNRKACQVNLSQPVLKALNDQINLEMASAYGYVAMAAEFAQQNLPGFDTWMQHQAREEFGHAMRLVEYVHDRAGTVVYGPIPGPVAEHGTVRQIFEAALKSEQRVSASIRDLYSLAVKESDFATQQMLGWFVTEQVEEEKAVSDILARLGIAQDAPAAILMLDRELGSRSGE